MFWLNVKMKRIILSGFRLRSTHYFEPAALNLLHWTGCALSPVSNYYAFRLLNQPA